MNPRPIALTYYCDENKRWEYQDYIPGQYCVPNSEILFNRPNLEDSIEVSRYRVELAEARVRIEKLEKYIVDNLLKSQK